MRSANRMPEPALDLRPANSIRRDPPSSRDLGQYEIGDSCRLRDDVRMRTRWPARSIGDGWGSVVTLRTFG